jgi:hypothetical protein
MTKSCVQAPLLQIGETKNTKNIVGFAACGTKANGMSSQLCLGEFS